MNVIKNAKTGKTVKDAISGKQIQFETEQDARTFADSMERNSVLGATAFNSTRPTKYVVAPA
jgi:hypothetical protein